MTRERALKVLLVLVGLFFVGDPWSRPPLSQRSPAPESAQAVAEAACASTKAASRS